MITGNPHPLLKVEGYSTTKEALQKMQGFMSILK
jgi:hypothetical protein